MVGQASMAMRTAANSTEGSGSTERTTGTSTARRPARCSALVRRYAALLGQHNVRDDCLSDGGPAQRNDVTTRCILASIERIGHRDCSSAIGRGQKSSRAPLARKYSTPQCARWSQCRLNRQPSDYAGRGIVGGCARRRRVSTDTLCLARGCDCCRIADS